MTHIFYCLLMFLLASMLPTKAFSSEVCGSGTSIDSVRVATIQELQSALDKACPGDLLLKFHPTGTGALVVDTPFGAEGATGRCA